MEGLYSVSHLFLGPSKAHLCTVIQQAYSWTQTEIPAYIGSVHLLLLKHVRWAGVLLICGEVQLENKYLLFNCLTAFLRLWEDLFFCTKKAVFSSLLVLRVSAEPGSSRDCCVWIRWGRQWKKLYAFLYLQKCLKENRPEVKFPHSSAWLLMLAVNHLY